MIKTRSNRLYCMVTIAVAAVALAGCPAAVKTPISFAAAKLTLTTVPPTMVRHMAITDVTLPEAMGGDGTLTYSLTPEVPGLRFDPRTRVLSGTPTTVDTHPMTYTATDSAGTAASVSFTVTVLPALRGTWRTTREWPNGRSDTETVTFTKSRYIVHVARYLPDGKLDWQRAESGTWESTDTTVTKTWDHDHDNDGETPDVETTISKDYVWGDAARNELLMHQFLSGRPDYAFERYERIPNPLQSPPIGRWQDGTYFVMDLGADGSFRLEVDLEEEGTYVLLAKWELNEDEYFLNLTGSRATTTRPGGSPVLPDDFALGKNRFAFAPADVPTRMVVSAHWEENDVSDNDNYERFGGYYRRMQRQ